MICTQCGADNPDEANFCGSCGTSIGSAFDSPSGPITGLGGHGEDEANADIAATKGAEVEPPAPVAASKPPTFSEPMPIPTQMPKPPPPQQPPAPRVHQQAPPVNPNQPGAGLAPPPPGTYAQHAQPGYGYSTPADGNTSGMGEGYQVPPEAEGWTFGSFIPWGLFSFINGNNLWGILFWVTNLFGLGLIYGIYVGINGRKQSWQGRRFDNMQQYVDTMKAWNTWGLGFFVFNLIVIGIYGLLIVIGIFAGISEEMANPGSY